MRSLLTSLFISGTLFTAAAVPRFDRIVSNASYIPEGLPSSGVAQGSIAAGFGVDMGPVQLTLADYPLPTTLAGTSIRISVGGQEVNAVMVFTSATQVAFIIPSNTPPGRAVARVIYNGETSAPFGFDVVRNAPGLFTLNSAGSGPAVLTDANFSVLTWNNAAKEGQAVIAWATGLTGLVGTPDNERPPVFDPQLAVEVFVGGKLANVRFRGRAPCCAGLDQIIFDIPAGVAGCNVSIVVRVGGRISNYATIPVATGSDNVCSDSNGFSSTELSSIPATGMRVGTISFIRARTKLTVPQFGSLDSTSDNGGAAFVRYNPGFFERSRGVGGVSFGSCTVFTFQGQAQGADPAAPIILDAGPQLTITGTSGSRNVPRQQGGAYGASLGMETMLPPGLPGGIPGLPGGMPLFLAPGEYTVTWPGGADIGASSARFRMAPQLNWTNEASITSIPRNADLTVTWSGGDPSNEFVTVIGSSFRQNPRVGASFVCTAPLSANSLTVPGIVLSALPPSDTIQGASTGSMSIFNGPFVGTSRFTAPGLDVGVIASGSMVSKNLTYQ